MTYAVIFTLAIPTAEGKGEDYGLAAQRMRQLAEQQPGYIGLESQPRAHPSSAIGP